MGKTGFRGGRVTPFNRGWGGLIYTRGRAREAQKIDTLVENPESS